MALISVHEMVPGLSRNGPQGTSALRYLKQFEYKHTASFPLPCPSSHNCSRLVLNRRKKNDLLDKKINNTLGEFNVRNSHC